MFIILIAILTGCTILVMKALGLPYDSTAVLESVGIATILAVHIPFWIWLLVIKPLRERRAQTESFSAQQ